LFGVTASVYGPTTLISPIPTNRYIPGLCGVTDVLLVANGYTIEFFMLFDLLW